MFYSRGIFVAMKPHYMYFLKCFMNFIINNPYVTGIYYCGPKRTCCKYILTRYSDILSGLLSRHGDLVKSLYSKFDIDLAIYIAF